MKANRYKPFTSVWCMIWTRTTYLTPRGKPLRVLAPHDARMMPLGPFGSVRDTTTILYPAATALYAPHNKMLGETFGPFDSSRGLFRA